MANLGLFCNTEWSIGGNILLCGCCNFVKWTMLARLNVYTIGTCRCGGSGAETLTVLTFSTYTRIMKTPGVLPYEFPIRTEALKIYISTSSTSIFPSVIRRQTVWQAHQLPRAVCR